MNEEEANIRTIGKDIIQIPERAMSGEEETPLPQGLQGAQDQARKKMNFGNNNPRLKVNEI